MHSRLWVGRVTLCIDFRGDLMLTRVATHTSHPPIVCMNSCMFAGSFDRSPAKVFATSSASKPAGTRGRADSADSPTPVLASSRCSAGKGGVGGASDGFGKTARNMPVIIAAARSGERQTAPSPTIGPPSDTTRAFVLLVQGRDRVFDEVSEAAITVRRFLAPTHPQKFPRLTLQAAAVPAEPGR